MTMWTSRSCHGTATRRFSGSKNDEGGKMNRWVYLLALPYIVIQTEFRGVANYSVANASGVVVGTCTDEAFCSDLANALNDSHQWTEDEKMRSEEPPEPTMSTPQDVTDK